MAPSSSPRSGRMLALLPIGVGVLLGALLLPVAAAPVDVPTPVIDQRALDATVEADRRLAREAHEALLPLDVRAVGSAVRALRRLQATPGTEEPALRSARSTLDGALGPALEAAGPDGLRRLRAVQLEGFLVETARFQRTGTVSTELLELAGGFVPGLENIGWIVGRHVLMNEGELRAAYKLAWNAAVGVENMAPLGLTLDEQRVLFGFYFRHPHPPEATLATIDLARHSAKDAAACAALDAGEHMAAEGWRIEKIRRFSSIDPTYPAAYALGIAQFRRGAYPAAVRAFREWLDGHPDGPYLVRARNFLRAALDADALSP